MIWKIDHQGYTQKDLDSEINHKGPRAAEPQRKRIKDLTTEGTEITEEDSDSENHKGPKGHIERIFGFGTLAAKNAKKELASVGAGLKPALLD